MTKLVLALIIGVLVFTATACAAGQEMKDINNSPAMPDKGNPNLDSRLNQLIDAEARGEAASYAEQSDIELIDGSVRVIIECVPDKIEAAIEAAKNAGATLETSFENLLQVVVPVVNLTGLADESSIKFIRLPYKPVMFEE